MKELTKEQKLKDDEKFMTLIKSDFNSPEEYVTNLRKAMIKMLTSEISDFYQDQPFNKLFPILMTIDFVDDKMTGLRDLIYSASFNINDEIRKMYDFIINYLLLEIEVMSNSKNTEQLYIESVLPVKTIIDFLSDEKK